MGEQFPIFFGTQNIMKIILFTITIFLSGCSTMMCVGTGVCHDGTMTFKGTQAKGQFTPQTIMLNGQPIIIVPEYSSQRTQSILIPGK